MTPCPLAFASLTLLGKTGPNFAVALRWRVGRIRVEALAGLDAELARIHAPIGLDIGAASPAEIAVAIMAQITERLREEAGAETPAVKVAS